MNQLNHLVGASLEEAIDEIEVYAVLNNQWLKVVHPDECLERKKLNICITPEGTIREFIFTG